MNIEIRADGVHIEGYVNVTGRQSRPLSNQLNGQFVEEIEAGAFQRAIEKAKCIRMLVDHENGEEVANTENGTLEAYEDKIGLRAKSLVTDEKVIECARAEKLRGWSFDMMNIEDEIEEREGQLPLRKIKNFDMSEISLIINKVPCYESTSVEVRAGETVERRAFENKVEVKDKTTIDYSEWQKQIDALKETK